MTLVWPLNFAIITYEIVILPSWPPPLLTLILWKIYRERFFGTKHCFYYWNLEGTTFWNPWMRNLETLERNTTANFQAFIFYGFLKEYTSRCNYMRANHDWKIIILIARNNIFFTIFLNLNELFKNNETLF